MDLLLCGLKNGLLDGFSDFSYILTCKKEKGKRKEKEKLALFPCIISDIQGMIKKLHI